MISLMDLLPIKSNRWKEDLFIYFMGNVDSWSRQNDPIRRQVIYIFLSDGKMSAFSIIKSLKKRVRLLIRGIFPFSTV